MDSLVTLDGQDQDVPLRFTILYVLRDGEWLFEAWHLYGDSQREGVSGFRSVNE